MTGLRRIVFAALASCFRALAWLPLGVAHAFEAAADWCEARARAPVVTNAGDWP
jgi:hypothetical protein